jgi:hypothetical protein
MAGLDPAIHAVPQTEAPASKNFFFEKKKQKTFIRLSRTHQQKPRKFPLAGPMSRPPTRLPQTTTPQPTTPVMAGLDPAIQAVPQTEAPASKNFFFEKKKQKIFIRLSRTHDQKPRNFPLAGPLSRPPTRLPQTTTPQPNTPVMAGLEPAIHAVPQKTLVLGVRDSTPKSFLLLFSKKEGLPPS